MPQIDNNGRHTPLIENADNAGPFWADDIPAAPVSIYFDTELEGFTHVTAKLNGVPFGVVPVQDDAELPYVFPWPVEPFPTPGRYELALEATKREGDLVTARVRIGTHTVIAMEDDGWHTLDSARLSWDQAPAKDGNLYDLLETSRLQVIAYAPALPAGAPVPAHYRQGQLMQARALWQSTLANSSDQINAEGFQVTVYPMDRTIKNVLRPHSAVPRMVGAGGW